MGFDFQSLPDNPVRLSFMARFKIALFILTFDTGSLLACEGEEDLDTRYLSLEWNGEMACRDSGRHHSSGTSFVTPFNKGQKHKSPFHSPTLHSLFTLHFLCVFCARLQPLLSTCTNAVCANRPRAYRSLLQSPCSQLYGILRLFLPLPMSDLTALARKTTAYSTAQRTEYRFRHLFILLGNCGFGYPLVNVESSCTYPVNAQHNG